MVHEGFFKCLTFIPSGDREPLLTLLFPLLVKAITATRKRSQFFIPTRNVNIPSSRPECQSFILVTPLYKTVYLHGLHGNSMAKTQVDLGSLFTQNTGGIFLVLLPLAHLFLSFPAPHWSRKTLKAQLAMPLSMKYQCR